MPLTPSMQPPRNTASNRWPSRVLAGAFLASAFCSVYVATRLLHTRCEGFSCTYLGVAWLFWLGVLCLPATGLGYLAQRPEALSRPYRRVLRVAWLAHGVFALGMLVVWLLQRR